MSVIHEGNSAFAAAQEFIVQFNSGSRATKQERISGKNFAKGAALTHSSIMKATRDLTMRFPVVCSDTISPNTAAMVVKAIERNCTTTLQLLFASTYLRGDNGIDVLRKFHKNIDDDITMDDYLNMADTLTKAIDNTGVVTLKGGKLAKAVDFINRFGESCTEESFIKEAVKGLSEDTVLDEDYSEKSIAVYNIQEAADGSDNFTVVLKEANKNNKNNKKNNGSNQNNNNGGLKRTSIDDYRKVINGMDSIRMNSSGKYTDSHGNYYNIDDLIIHPASTSDNPIWISKDQYDRNMAQLRYNQDLQQQMYNQMKNEYEMKDSKKKLDFEKEKFEFEKKKFAHNSSFDKEKFEHQKEEEDKEALVKQQQMQNEYFQKQLLDNDVRKCNELVPTLIIIRYADVNATMVTTAAVDQQFIAGVKAWMYPETSANIISKVSDVFSKSTGKLGWIRATTGEINFMKDFLLGIGKAKITAKNDSLEKSSPIWRHLKYRSSKSVLNRLIKGKPNDAGAITTLVLSSEEVDYLKKEMDIDLTNIKNAQKLMEAYNFMGIVIVDENFEVARFLFDGASYYEDIAFASLEREDKDSSYKKVVNLISKINRG